MRLGLHFALLTGLVIAGACMVDVDRFESGPGAGGAATSAGGAGTTSTGVGGNPQTGSGGSGGATGCAYREAVMNDGPIAYWRLDEPTEETVAQNEVQGTSGAGGGGGGVGGGTALVGTYIGVTRGAPPLIHGCPDSTAVELTQSNDQITFLDADPNVFRFAPDRSFSIELWVALPPPSMSAMDDNGPIMGRRSGNVGWSLNAGLDQKILVRRADTLIESTNQTEETPHHVVATFDGVTKTLCLRIDNVLAGNCMVVLSSLATDSVIDLVLGDGGFLGTVDEVAIYDRPLSPSEIQAHYLAGKAPD